MPASLRSEFPVLERIAYLNAGSVGPVPRTAATAASAEIDRQLAEGRGGTDGFERMLDLADRLRARVAGLVGCEPVALALTGATTDGVNAVVGGLDLGPGDEVLTSDEEHPGLLAPLAAARERHGISIRVVPFAELAQATRPDTKLIACSHVSWRTGRVADTAGLAACGQPVLLDGAQALGAVPVDVEALGCDFYAASGQKWLCGPIGSGYLYVRPDRLGDLAPIAPGYGTLEDPSEALGYGLREGAARFDAGLMPSHHSAWAHAALDTLEGAGIDSVLARGPELAQRLASDLAAKGLVVAPRGRSTLISWEAGDPEAESKRLLAQGFLIRHLPGTSYVRASVGAWTSEEELAGLAAAATSGS